MPRVSAIIPCYNAERFVGGAIQSMLDQVYEDLEVIVVDDGSTDGSREVVAGFDDRRVRYLYQENRGPAAARNTGIAAAVGEFIAPLDADDLALPHRVADQLAVLEAGSGISVVGSGYVWIDEAGARLSWVAHSWQKYPELNEFRDWLFDCPLVPSATMFRRSAWEDVGGFDEELVGPEDWNFWMRLALRGHRMTWHRDVVCLYRYRQDSLSNDAQRMSANCAKALNRIMAHPDFPPELMQAGREGLAVRYVDGTKRLFTAGLWEEGGEMLAKALDLVPGLLENVPSRLEDELMSAALGPFVTDSMGFLGTMFRHLPDNARLLLERRQQMLIRAHVELLLRGLRHGDGRLVRAHLWPALAGQPRWLSDRGTWAIVVRALRTRLRPGAG